VTTSAADLDVAVSVQARIKDEYDRMEKKLKIMEARMIRHSKATEVETSRRPADRLSAVVQNGARPMK
jgi:hypothetical protein